MLSSGWGCAPALLLVEQHPGFTFPRNNSNLNILVGNRPIGQPPQLISEPSIAKPNANSIFIVPAYIDFCCVQIKLHHRYAPAPSFSKTPA